MAKRYARFLKSTSPWFVDERGKSRHLKDFSARELQKLIDQHYRHDLLARDAKANGLDYPPRVVDHLTDRQEADIMNFIETVAMMGKDLLAEEIVWLKTKDTVHYKIMLETWLQALRAKIRGPLHNVDDWLNQVKREHESGHPHSQQWSQSPHVGEHGQEN